MEDLTKIDNTLEPRISEFLNDFGPNYLEYLEQNLDYSIKKEKQEHVKNTNIDISTKKEKEEDIKNATHVDESSLITELIKIKGFIGNEHWEKTININSRISSYNKEYVICDCLIDKEKNLFEKRSFPRHLFNHIENIKLNPYVLLSIQSKVGSIRINVIKGEKLVDKKAFELEEEWNKLDGTDFNLPLDKPIQL